MTKQLLFYESVVPVSPQRHNDLCIERTDFSFASEVNSVPLMAVEIPRAAREYTIVFAGSQDAVTPVVILGVEGSENLYVGDDNSWSGDYIPAFVRRFPFVFSRSEDGKTFTLCVDENWSGCNREGRGERLFDEKGERTEYLKNMLGFLEQYQAHFVRTQAYCDKLRDLELLETMQAEFTLPGGQKRSLGGFMAVNREKLKNLAPEKLADLMKTDELELTFNHLLSMNNFAYMLQRASQRSSPAAPGDPSPEGDPATDTSTGS